MTYASLNFRDIMLASGKLPPDAIPGDKCKKADCLLGMEFSGRDSQGNRVMGLTPAKVTIENHCNYGPKRPTWTETTFTAD